MRNNVISICKGIAIILMVLGHTEGPGFLMHIVYLFHMPIFFITAGYFFSRKYLSEPWTFVVKRFKGLYVPMVKWALFFLLTHNLMFKIGLLSEQYGNWENGVTHPYDLHAFLQRAVSIVTSMSGYDEFLAGRRGCALSLLRTPHQRTLVAGVGLPVHSVLRHKIRVARHDALAMGARCGHTSPHRHRGLPDGALCGKVAR